METTKEPETMRRKTSLDYFYESHRKRMDGMHTFLNDILPDLTLEEYEKLCAKRPGVYEKYRKLVYNVKGGNS